MSTDIKPKAGLEDVVAASSAICYLDGDRGVLAYYGYDIHDLARGATFEEVCYLLWHGRLPNRAELGDLQSQLAAARPLSEQVLRFLKQLPASDPSTGSGSPRAMSRGDGMDTLRTMTSVLGHYDPDAADDSPQANYRKAVRLTGQLASLVATYGRLQAGGGPIQPDPALGHAANFLYMLTGARPNALSTRAFDVALVLHADHELNASTFAGRVAAATLTDLHSAIVGAIGALKGPLHGGANADVMRLLIEIGQDATPDRIDEAIRSRLARKVKIPGFGHRVYRTEDPRATHLRRMSKELGERAGNRRWFEMSERIEKLVTGEKKLYANVDFYSASTYYTLGIPIDLYTPIFAVSRVSGWTAHCLEQYKNNRLIRPRTDYIGPAYPQSFLPLEQR
jgi:2-methylcitrate synthase